MKIDSSDAINAVKEIILIMKDQHKIPCISVVMAIYKEPLEWIRQSIDSILNQTFSDFEFIIVNDNPARGENREILSEYSSKDSRIVVISNKVNIGLTRSLNKGLRIAKGEFIARMDADDIALSERFDIQYNTLISSGSEVCWSAFSIIDANGKTVTQYKNNPNLSQLVVYNIIAHPTVLFKRNLLSLRQTFYNESFKRAQDYELWAFLNSKGVRFINNPTVILLYRQSSSQVTSLNQVEQLSSFREMRKKYIANILSEIGVRFNNSNLLETIKTLELIIKNSSAVDQRLLNIRYLLYINLAAIKPKYMLQYLLRHRFYADIKYHKRIIVLSALKFKKYPLFEL